ncbi:unnamed protein product [Soboliphyme baturini]|uniref:TPR_REGION domain-containing protein n=1 Tax=Soboliphyme baturini TaxID=241478 RepID=A0A183J9F6_9BILA|nr:unnamed protein product [Soboliphyme baturini]
MLFVELILLYDFCDFSGALYASCNPTANQTDLYFFNALPNLRCNIASLVKEKKYELAVQLAANIPDENNDERTKRVHDIKHYYAFDLYRKRRFSDAFQIYSEIGAGQCRFVLLHSH